MVAQVRRPSAGRGVSAEARPRDQPPVRRSRRRIHAGRRQHPACLAEIVAAEPMLLQSNSGDRCQPPPAQNPFGRRHNREDRRRAKTESWPSTDGLRRQNSKCPKMRSRLSNGLPISGEGRPGGSIVALPGPCGGRGSSDEPRGLGSLDIDRELTAFVRFIGLFDNGTAPSSFAGHRGGDGSTSRGDLCGYAERLC
jgi:hypothetical protein